MIQALRKGTAWRTACQDWFRSHGWLTSARPHYEAGDDLTAVRGSVRLSVECKNHRSIDLAAFVDQAERQAPQHAIPVCVIHRRNRAGVDAAYVVLSGSAFARLVGP